MTNALSVSLRRLRSLSFVACMALCVGLAVSSCGSSKSSSSSKSSNTTSKVISGKNGSTTNKTTGGNTSKKTTNNTNKKGSGSGGSSSLTKGSTFSGKASYYADKFEGKSTASGEPYKASKLTAAHRTLPFGTMLRVTNTANGKSVDVRVNDRGPFSAGRVVDLSKAAAQKIDMVRAGVVSVSVEVISVP